MSKLSKKSKNLAANLSSVTHLDYDLNDKQHVELLEIACSTNEKGSVIIEELCSKGDQLPSNECNLFGKCGVNMSLNMKGIKGKMVLVLT